MVRAQTRQYGRIWRNSSATDEKEEGHGYSWTALSFPAVGPVNEIFQEMLAIITASQFLGHLHV